VLKSTAGGTLGILLPYRTCSMSGRRRKTSGLLCGVTSRRVGIECEDRRARGSSLGRGLDPKPRTIWQRYPRGHTCSSQSVDWPLLASTGRAEASCNSFQVCRERRFRYRPHKTGAMFVRPSGANRKVPCARRPNTLPRSPLCLGEHSRRSVNWITTVGRVKGGNSDPHPIHNFDIFSQNQGLWAASYSSKSLIFLACLH
jgi:hypothetical protein